MSETNRADIPHTAVINFTIAVHKVLKDGSLDPIPVSTDELNKYAIAPNASIKVDGVDRASCIDNIKKKLEKFNG
tara:strand:+ start:213 stop:437 length:225 start_codon:yes stop_codon:yes gene_type:complete